MVVVNLFGEPGAGKSTGAAYIFSALKMHGINAELVTEYAKEKVWEETPLYLKIKFIFLVNNFSKFLDVKVRLM